MTFSRCHEARARVVGFLTDGAIELSGMADRLVNRQPQIGWLENQIVLTRLHALRHQLLSSDRRPSFGIARHVQRLDIFPARAARGEFLVVALKVAVADRRRREVRSDTDHRLCDVGAFGRHQRLHLAKQSETGGDEADVRHLQRRLVGREQKRDLVLERYVERIARHRCDPRAGDWLDWGELDAAGLHRTRGTRQHDRLERGRLRASASHHARRGEPPRAVDQRAHAETVRLVIADAEHLPLARRHALTTVATDAHVSIGRTRSTRGVERVVGKIDHGRLGRSGG